MEPLEIVVLDSLEPWDATARDKALQALSGAPVVARDTSRINPACNSTSMALPSLSSRCPWKRRTSQNEDPSASRSGRSPLPLRSRFGLVLGEELVVAATVGEAAPPFGESMGPMSSS